MYDWSLAIFVYACALANYGLDKVGAVQVVCLVQCPSLLMFDPACIFTPIVPRSSEAQMKKSRVLCNTRRRFSVASFPTFSSR